MRRLQSCDLTLILLLTLSTVNSFLLRNPQYKPCNAYCLDCIEGEKCVSCYEGSYLDQMTEECIPCSPDSICKICDSEGVCQLCDPLYALNESSGKCEKNKCTNLFCSDCLSSGKCIKCHPGFYMYDNLCYPCSKCEGCEDISSSSFCRSTLTKDEESNRKCLPSIQGCKSCLNETTCEKCEEGNYLNESTCQKCKDVNCFTCESGGKCLMCNLGFYLNDNKCLKCPSNCLICSDNKFCKKCKSNFFELNGECFENCKNSIAGCKLCTDDQTCKQCKQGLYLNNNQCIKCPDPYAITCDNNGISNACKEFYVLHSQDNSLMCVPRNINCKEFNSDFTCKSCPSEFYLNYRQECDICDSSHFPLNNNCLSCKENYKACESCISEKCTKCSANAIFYGDTCECKDGYFYLFDECIHNGVIGVSIIILIIVTVIIYYLVRNFRSALIPNDDDSLSDDSINNANVLELKELVGDRQHGSKCVYGDNNESYWKLNCGGYVCNKCSIKIMNLVSSNSEASCPKCRNNITNFEYLDRSTCLEPSIHQSASTTLNLYNIEESCEKCSICIYFKATVLINCNSQVPHKVCDYCFKRVFIIEGKKICPFCKAMVKFEN